MLDKMNFITDLDLKIDEENWINSLKKTQWGSGYQIPNWLEIYKKSFNSIPLFISVKNQNSEIVGQLACIIHEEYNWNDASSFSKLIGTKLKLKSVLTWAYGPIIHDTKNQQEIINSILTKIEEIIKKYNITMVRGFTSPDSELKTEIFDKFDYTLQNWSTYSLNLKTDPETIL